MDAIVTDIEDSFDATGVEAAAAGVLLAKADAAGAAAAVVESGVLAFSIARRFCTGATGGMEAGAGIGGAFRFKLLGACLVLRLSLLLAPFVDVVDAPLAVVDDALLGGNQRFRTVVFLFPPIRCTSDRGGSGKFGGTVEGNGSAGSGFKEERERRV